MPINADKPQLWKADVERSLDLYNDWFLKFAPETFRAQRRLTSERVLAALKQTDQLRNLNPGILREHPELLSVLRMTTSPPLARDRLMGLAYVGRSVIKTLEGDEHTPPRIPPRLPRAAVDEQLGRICDVLSELADRDLCGWLGESREPDQESVERAAIVIADRLCGAAADPIIRNAQEER